MVYASYPGAYGKANVGISNDKGGENPPRRKTEVSRAPNGEADGRHG